MTYRTEARTRLLDLLSSSPEQALTAGQIALALYGDGKRVSTVYRLLAKLGEEGIVRRVVPEDGGACGFRYDPRGLCSRHIHLCCTACGRTVHLDALLTAQIEATLARTLRFSVDEEKTTLYGLCQACRGV